MEVVEQPMNEYRFTTLRSLRAVLRSYRSLRSLAQAGDFTSAAILLDLQRALGDDPSSGVTVLTPRQKQAITLHLIQDLSVHVVAEEMGVQWRVVYLIVNNGLRRLLAFLHSGKVPNEWQQWQLDYVRRNLDLPRKEIAAHVRRSPMAVRLLICRLRKLGEVPEGRGGRASCERSQERRAS